jgi:hypothetical protein
MAQVVSRRPLTAESWVRARVNPCAIYGRKCGTGISNHDRSPYSYHLGDEQYVR